MPIQALNIETLSLQASMVTRYPNSIFVQVNAPEPSRPSPHASHSTKRTSCPEAYTRSGVISIET